MRVSASAASRHWRCFAGVRRLRARPARWIRTGSLPGCGRRSKPRPVRYAMFLDGIGPGSFDDRWSRRGLRY
ncbi:hypothetical protein THIOKS11710057 [Thiocapsa sp. KS1]|nr:hypothetical protein THIOKS11710057 [Thiocapsa sp. KS1]